MGHVNNSVYLTYLEEARNAYWRWLLDTNKTIYELKEEVYFIGASARIEFKNPLFLGDEIIIYVRMTKIGKTSFALEYRIEGVKDKRLKAKAETIQVLYDYKNNRKIEFPLDLREMVKKKESLP
jgi:acyl-CoA thioester hydrolase